MTEINESDKKEACDFCERPINDVDYLINMQNGDTLCTDCRTITDYNGDGI